METFYFSGITIDEFFNRLKTVIEAAQLPDRGEAREQSSSYLSRKEVIILLKISLPTLHSWSKHGILKSHKLGNRVLYRRDEIENAIAGISEIKYKKLKL